MGAYYRDTLAAERLERAYRIAPPRVRRYLDAELEYALSRIGAGDVVLELGCGYGRVLEPLARHAKRAVGIDTSPGSLIHARRRLARLSNSLLALMDASRLGFGGDVFDCTVCIQNGISAFHVDPHDLMRESVRVTKAGGRVLFSSYSEAFWEHRLAWFERQAEEGLIGEIDREKTRDGMIVCRDGFTATTFGADRFESIARVLGLGARIVEIDGSSIFCEIVPAAGSEATEERGPQQRGSRNAPGSPDSPGRKGCR